MMLDWKSILVVALGGAAGSVTRYLAGVYALSIQEKLPGSPQFPWSTFAVNIIGAFLIGILAWVCKESKVWPDWTWLFLATGFMGGLTTFSSLCNETLTLLRNENYGLAAGYVTLSFVLGMLGVAAGFGLGKVLIR